MWSRGKRVWSHFDGPFSFAGWRRAGLGGEPKNRPFRDEEEVRRKGGSPDDLDYHICVLYIRPVFLTIILLEKFLVKAKLSTW